MICLLTTLFGGFYYMADKAIAQPTPTQDPFLASLSAPTPTPHIPINYQAGTNSIFKDAFIDNRNSWQNEEDLTSITVEGENCPLDHYTTETLQLHGAASQPVISTNLIIYKLIFL